MAIRRTKAQMSAARYNKEVDAYKWYVVDLKQKKAITGFEYKEDAEDLLRDYDGDKNFKIVAKSSLKKLFVSIPNNKFKGLDQPKSSNLESKIREKIAATLSNVTKMNAPKIHSLIQNESGYKMVENAIIIKMARNNFTASACIPHIERTL